MAPIARFRFRCARSFATAAAVLSCATACLPARDLDEYRAASVGRSADGATPLDSTPAGLDGGSGGVAELPLPNPELDTSSVDGSKLGSGGPGDVPGAGRADAGGEPSSVDAGFNPCATEERLGPNGHCYFFNPNPLGFELARAACQERGTGWDLASVRSAADSAFLGEVLAFEAWVGASDADSEGTWVWVVDDQPFWLGTGTTGSAVDGAFVNWNATEPNGANATNCARALPRSFGSPIPDAPWADLGCEAPLGAICEAYPSPPS